MLHVFVSKFYKTNQSNVPSPSCLKTITQRQIQMRMQHESFGELKEKIDAFILYMMYMRHIGVSGITDGLLGKISTDYERG